MLNNKSPAIEVYTFPMTTDLSVIKNSVSPFRRIFSDLEAEKLINLYIEKTKITNLFNGKSVRLDKVSRNGDLTVVEVSMINFFDFLLTTMLFNQSDSFKEFCRERHMYEEQVLIERLCETIQGAGSDDSFQDIISTKEFSNILAVSVLVEDKNGLVALMRRSKNLAVSSGFFSIAATGSLDEQDFKETNPFISCAKRELSEELNIVTDSIVLDEFVMSKHKRQPIALLNVKLPIEWKEIAESVKSAQDFNKETQEIYAVPTSSLSQFLYSETFTDAASYQIYKRILSTESSVVPVSDAFDKEQFLI